MSEIAQINMNSWELAAIAMSQKGKDVEAYSTSQIRKIMNAANSPDYHAQIRKVIVDYIPAPPQNIKANQAQKILRKKREKNKDFGERLLASIKNYDASDVQKLLKYTLWNIKIIEQNMKGYDNKLSLILECENLENKDMILGQLKNISSSDHNPRKSYGKDNRGQTGRDYRRRG